MSESVNNKTADVGHGESSSGFSPIHSVITPGGFPLRSLNIGIIVVASVLAALLFISVVMTSQSYSALHDATEKYITCQKNASDILAASDYLTSEARAFAATGDRAHIRNYFDEADTVRRRETSLESLSRYFTREELAPLYQAMELSRSLMDREFYSMYLAALADGLEPSVLNAALGNISLEPGDELLAPDQLRSKAVTVLFDREYDLSKRLITEYVNVGLEKIIDSTRKSQQESMDSHLVLLRAQRVLIVLLVVVVIIALVLISALVFSPMRKAVTFIRSQKFIPLSGSREFRVLAANYNRIFEKVRVRQEELSYEATHDPLTGLSNRGVFDKIVEAGSSADMALLVVDVDRFKEINDSFGHQAGDTVLKSVAAHLTSCFRAGDCICRIGGDEFAVVMSDVTPDHRELIRSKIAFIRNSLLASEDIPHTTLSVGVAFGAVGSDMGSVFKRADSALYKVKNGGKDGVEFFN